MFKCEICHRTVPPCTPSTRIVVKTRPKQYPKRVNANQHKHHGRLKITDDPGGQGYEIVQEVTACPTCATAYSPSSSLTQHANNVGKKKYWVRYS